MNEILFQGKNIGLGKRKQAIARVFLIPGAGNITINNTSGPKYFQHNDTYLDLILGPLRKVNLQQQFDIVVIVKGGGLTGQAEAIQLGIARQLCKIDQKNRMVLKPLGFLTRNARIKERKKYGLKKARKAPQYSKR